MIATQDPPRPLHGIRILDFSTTMAGPYCTRLLADLGADVIKIESAHGDTVRTRAPLRDGSSTYFGHLNCGKRSVVVDLKSNQGAAVARQLATSSDVIVENFRPGVMKRLGLDAGTLLAVDERLIYCSISGFGQAGPGAARPAYAPIIHAAMGLDLAQLSYQDGHDRPAKTAIFIADVLGGLYAFGAIQTALYMRERTSRGQSIDVTLMEAVLNLLVYEVQEAQFPAEQRRSLYEPLRATDGYVMIAAISQKSFEALVDSIGRPDLKADPLFATPAARERNGGELLRVLEAWTATRTAEECEAHLGRAGVPVSRYRTVREAMQDPALLFRGAFSQVTDAAGSFTVPNPAFQFSGATATAMPFVAALDEHTDEVLTSLLGYNSCEIDTLRRAGAIGCGDSRREEGNRR